MQMILQDKWNYTTIAPSSTKMSSNVLFLMESTSSVSPSTFLPLQLPQLPFLSFHLLPFPRGSNARLIGVEYVINETIFGTLDSEEQKLWHSHGYDIKSGSLIAPGHIPDHLKKTLYNDLVHTYGKTWVLWQVDKGDPLPLGLPQLMMVATNEGEWNPSLFRNREAR
jgi:hypothetical protein